MIGRGQEASVHPWALIRKVSREEAINAIPGISGCYNTPITRREQDKFLWLIFEPTFPEQSVKEEATCKFCRRTLKGTSALYHARAHLGFKPFPCSNKSNGCMFRGIQQSDVNKHMRKCPKDPRISRRPRVPRGKRKPRPVAFDMNAGAHASDSHGTVDRRLTDQENDLLRQNIVPREQDQSVLTRVHIEPAWLVPSTVRLSGESYWSGPLDDTPSWPPNSNG